MHAFDSKMKLQHYSSPEKIIDAFYPIRLDGYYRRKSYQLAQLAGEELKLKNQARFVSDILSKNIELMNSGQSLPTEIMNQILRSNGYSTEQEIKKISSVNPILDEKFQSDDKNDYDYLLDLPIRSLTTEKAESLFSRANKAQQSLEELRNLTPEQIWLDELKKLETELVRSDDSYLK